MTAGMVVLFITFLFFLASRRLDLRGRKLNPMYKQLKRLHLCGVRFFHHQSFFKKSTPRLMDIPYSLSPYYQSETWGVPTLFFDLTLCN